MMDKAAFIIIEIRKLYDPKQKCDVVVTELVSCSAFNDREEANEYCAKLNKEYKDWNCRVFTIFF